MRLWRRRRKALQKLKEFKSLPSWLGDFVAELMFSTALLVFGLSGPRRQSEARMKPLPPCALSSIARMGAVNAGNLDLPAGSLWLCPLCVVFFRITALVPKIDHDKSPAKTSIPDAGKTGGFVKYY